MLGGLEMASEEIAGAWSSATSAVPHFLCIDLEETPESLSPFFG